MRTRQEHQMEVQCFREVTAIVGIPGRRALVKLPASKISVQQQHEEITGFHH